jgi:Uma2 family endonuclease
MTVVSVPLPLDDFTLDDVAELAERDPDHRYELQEGNLLIMSPPDSQHAQLASLILVWLVTGGHAAERVLQAVGVRAGSRTGRSPDVALLRATPVEPTVWLDPRHVLLAIEIVSPSSMENDRVNKPAEYAKAGIPHFWRVERDGPPTVHLFDLITGADGRPVYLPTGAVLLKELLAGPVPELA